MCALPLIPALTAFAYTADQTIIVLINQSGHAEWGIDIGLNCAPVFNRLPRITGMRRQKNQ